MPPAARPGTATVRRGERARQSRRWVDTGKVVRPHCSSSRSLSGSQADGTQEVDGREWDPEQQWGAVVPANERVDGK